MHDSLCETLCFHSADKRDMHGNLHKDLCRKVEMIERSIIDYRKIYDPTLQMKDIYMIAYFRINVPTAGERDM